MHVSRLQCMCLGCETSSLHVQGSHVGQDSRCDYIWLAPIQVNTLHPGVREMPRRMGAGQQESALFADHRQALHPIFQNNRVQQKVGSLQAVVSLRANDGVKSM